MKADYVHKDSLTATDYVNLQKENELIINYNQQLLKEKQQLKERVAYLERSIERKDDTIIELRNNNNFCNRTDCSSRIKDSKKYDSLEQKIEKQQQEFIKYLKSINSFETVSNILNKYKEIIGGNKDE